MARKIIENGVEFGTNRERLNENFYELYGDKHAHDNADVLDKFSENGGEPLYNGVSLVGKPGKDGADGRDGVDGKSAYEVWLSQGNTGTEQDFLDSLSGNGGGSAMLWRPVLSPDGILSWELSNSTTPPDAINIINIRTDGASAPDGSIIIKKLED